GELRIAGAPVHMLGGGADDDAALAGVELPQDVSHAMRWRDDERARAEMCWRGQIEVELARGARARRREFKRARDASERRGERGEGGVGGRNPRRPIPFGVALE